MIAVELDPNWTQVLRTRAPSWGDVTVVAADALRVPFPAERFYVVSSAPYAIGTKLVRRVLTDAHGLVRAVFVLQREAALRLARDGRFAASWAPWFELRVHGRIPARAFRPVPSVESAILTVVPRPVPLLTQSADAQPADEAFADQRLQRSLSSSGACAVDDDRLPRRRRIPPEPTRACVAPSSDTAA